jgi:hypothetical protein
MKKYEYFKFIHILRSLMLGSVVLELMHFALVLELHRAFLRLYLWCINIFMLSEVSKNIIN